MSASKAQIGTTKDDYVLVARSALLSTSSSESSGTDEKKNDKTNELLVKAVKTLQLLSPNKTYKFRIVSDVLSFSTSTSTTSTLKYAWDPTAQAEFSTLAALFGEYRVVGIRFHFWPIESGHLAAADQGKNPFLILYGSDPAAMVSGTPTALTVQALAHCVRMSSKQHTSSAEVSTIRAAGVRSAVLNLAPTVDGFIGTGVGWPGQSCFFSQAVVSGTILQMAFTIDWMLEFKARG